MMSIYEKTKRTENENLPVLCRLGWYDIYHGFEKHYHNAVEIIAMLSGEMKCTIDNRIYMLKRGDTVLINPYSVHSGYVTAENSTHLVLTLTLSDVLNYHNSAVETCANHLENGQCFFDEYLPADQEENNIFYQHILSLYEHIQNQDPASEMVVMGEVYNILSMLFEKHYHTESDRLLHKINKQFMQQFSEYLEENYAKPITTSDAAQALFMSPSRFSYLIKQHFGYSFTQYLCQYRIDYAIKHYSESNCSIKEIAKAVGFGNYCYFTRTFKEYMGITPAVYFKKKYVE